MTTFWPPIRYSMSAGQEVAINGRWLPVANESVFKGAEEPSEARDGDYWFHPDEGLYQLVDDGDSIYWQAVAV